MSCQRGTLVLNSCDRAVGTHRLAARAPMFQVVQWHLVHKKHHPGRTQQWPCALGPMVVLGGWLFLMNESPVQ